jgi:hypothetical protein
MYTDRNTQRQRHMQAKTYGWTGTLGHHMQTDKHKDTDTNIYVYWHERKQTHMHMDLDTWTQRHTQANTHTGKHTYTWPNVYRIKYTGIWIHIRGQINR